MNGATLEGRVKKEVKEEVEESGPVAAKRRKTEKTGTELLNALVAASSSEEESFDSEGNPLQRPGDEAPTQLSPGF